MVPVHDSLLKVDRSIPHFYTLLKDLLPSVINLQFEGASLQCMPAEKWIRSIDVQLPGDNVQVSSNCAGSATRRLARALDVVDGIEMFESPMYMSYKWFT